MAQVAGAARVLAYDRIDANRRAARGLLVLFAVVSLPVAAYLSLYVLVLAGMVLGTIVVSFGVTELFSEDNVGLALALLVVVGIGIVVVSCVGMYLWSASIVLRLSGAKPLAPQEETDLRRTVENLCIGAGLPLPRLYVIESRVANAFSTGLDPDHSVLVVTRGALQLLEEAELQAVLSHELVQIGNYDTRLSTILAAGLALLRLPATMVLFIIRALFRVHWALGGGVVLYFGVPTVLGFVSAFYLTLSLMDEEPLLGLLVLASLAFPLYVFIAAPLLADFIRIRVLKRRLVLADADAVLLCRNAEAMARGLVKMGASAAPGLRASAATAHLYTVDPLHHAAWWERLFSTHPPLGDRVAAVAAMGGGVPASVLEAAHAAGAAFIGGGDASQGPATQVCAQVPPANGEEGSTAPVEPNAYRIDGDQVPVFESPDPSSTVVLELPRGALVTVYSAAGDFLQIITPDDRFGYILAAAKMTAVDITAAKPSGEVSNKFRREAGPTMES